MKFTRLGLWSLSVLTLIYFGVYTLVHQQLIQASADSSGVPVTVIIDAGHGGEDCGAVSLSSVYESDINLMIAKKLEQMMSLCGVNTKMIRSDERSVYTEGETIRERKISDLKNRVQMISDTDHAVLLSIHQNHFPQDRYSGAQVFYAKTQGSKELAACLQSVLSEVTNPSSRREIKRAESVYLMNNIACTGVLVECGFLSNPQEDLLLQDDSYQKKLTCAMTGAVLQYLEEGSGEVEI